MKQMTPQMLKERMDGGAAPLLIDVREPWEYEICHIAGSRSLPMGQIPQRYNEIDRVRETVVICHYGMRSAQAAAYLARQGMDNIVNLAGGIDAWAKQVDPSMPVY